MDQKIMINGKTYLIPESETGNVEQYLKKIGVDLSDVEEIREIAPNNTDTDGRSLLHG